MNPPPVSFILETALYVADLNRSVAFYRDTLGLTVLRDLSPRLVAIDGGGTSVLLLFQQGETGPIDLPNGHIPGHGATGIQHFAFEVTESGLGEWETYLKNKGLKPSPRVPWPGGSQSIYLADPDGHILEFATPGLWRP